MIVPNHTDCRLVEVSYNPDLESFEEIEAPIIAWQLDPGCDWLPVSLLGSLDGLAWAVIEPPGRAYTWDTVFATRAEAVQELRHQAKRLAGVDP